MLRFFRKHHECFVPKPLEMSLAHRQIVYSASVTISRAYGCQGNCDITADIVMHENSNSRGAVARRPELREVMGQRAKLIVVL